MQVNALYGVNVTVYVTIYTLVLIAVIRFMAVVYNEKTRCLRSHTSILCITVALWLVMLAVSVPVIFIHGVKQYGSLFKCTIYIMEYGKKLYLTFFIFAYIVPQLTLSVLYLLVTKNLRTKGPEIIANNRQSEALKKKAT